MAAVVASRFRDGCVSSSLLMKGVQSQVANLVAFSMGSVSSSGSPRSCGPARAARPPPYSSFYVPVPILMS